MYSITEAIIQQAKAREWQRQAMDDRPYRLFSANCHNPDARRYFQRMVTHHYALARRAMGLPE